MRKRRKGFDRFRNAKPNLPASMFFSRYPHITEAMLQASSNPAVHTMLASALLDRLGIPVAEEAGWLVFPACATAASSHFDSFCAALSFYHRIYRFSTTRSESPPIAWPCAQFPEETEEGSQNLDPRRFSTLKKRSHGL